MSVETSFNQAASAYELSKVIDWIRYSMSCFQRAGVFYGHGTDNAWDEASSLVFQALALPSNLPESQYRAVLTSKVTQSEIPQIVDWIKQRTQDMKPLPYITHQAWFLGMPFYVDERVLIPRSPFAELIENRFKNWLSNEPTSILDLCTGGGCIAIALAYCFEDSIVDAIDIDNNALDVASINIHEYQLEQRVIPIQSDLFSNVTGQKYDLIVSNPPYVDAEDMADLPLEYSHEPKLALAAGEDGLDLVEQILRESPGYMTENAWLFVEVGNSSVHFEERFPNLAVQWCELKQGGSGVFAVHFTSLKTYFDK